jgi:hypothetical protein
MLNRSFLEAVFFGLLLVAAIALFLHYLLNRHRGVQLSHLMILSLSVFAVWVATMVGQQIDIRYGETLSTKPRTSKLFQVAFPSYYLYVIVTLLLVVFALSRIGAWRGLVLGQRDKSLDSPLPQVILYSREPLPLDGDFDATSQVYRYQSLRFIDVNKDQLFILAPDPSGETYKTVVLPNGGEIMFEVNP